MCQEKFYVWFSFQLPQQVKHHRLIKSKTQIVQNTALYQLLRRNSLYSSWKQDRSISFWKMILVFMLCRPKQINEHVENIGSAVFRKRLSQPASVSLHTASSSAGFGCSAPSVSPLCHHRWAGPCSPCQAHSDRASAPDPFLHGWFRSWGHWIQCQLAHSCREPSGEPASAVQPNLESSKGCFISCLGHSIFLLTA